MRHIQVTDADWKWLMNRKTEQKAKKVAVIVSQVIEEAKSSKQ